MHTLVSRLLGVMKLETKYRPSVDYGFVMYKKVVLDYCVESSKVHIDSAAENDF